VELFVPAEIICLALPEIIAEKKRAARSVNSGATHRGSTGLESRKVPKRWLMVW
jgi:hypothetical protein